VEQLRRRHPHVDFDTVVADASDCSQENITRVSQACEGRDLGILVNNVGVLQNQKKMDLSDLAYEDVVSTITVNCAFNALVTRALLKQLLTNARGHRCAVINISSVLAFAAFPGFSIYTATKSFMHSLSESMAAELAGTNVDVLCVSPGYTASNMTMEKPSLLVSSADSVAEESLRRIRFVQVVPGILPMLMFLTIGSINFLPSLLRPRVVKFISSCMVYTAKGLKTQ
jgi:17beta-estradiol 17-dehydrogenase / very-long-chain 3-oxoacyl-CoA reductase